MSRLGGHVIRLALRERTERRKLFMKLVSSFILTQDRIRELAPCNRSFVTTADVRAYSIFRARFASRPKSSLQHQVCFAPRPDLAVGIFVIRGGQQRQQTSQFMSC